MRMTANEINIPIMVTSDQPSEAMQRKILKELAETCKNGKGKYKVRTASGCFNKWC